MRKLHEWDKPKEEMNLKIFDELDRYKNDDIATQMFWDRYYDIYIGRHEYFLPLEISYLIAYTAFSIGVSVVWYNYT